MLTHSFGKLALLSLSLVVAMPGAPTHRDFKLVALKPDFWKLIDRNESMTEMGTGFGFTEGPAWNEKEHLLYVSDEVQNKIYKLFPNGRKETLISLGNPDGNTLDKNGNLIDCASDLRAILLISPDGKYRIMADRYNDRKLNTPNDIVRGPDSAWYFTDPTMDLRKGEHSEQPVKGVYRLDDNGHLTLLIKDLKQPNGLAFSPDGQRLYIDDSEDRSIHAYKFRKGAVSDGRIFGTEEGEEKSGVPDGMRVDRAGNLYVTGPLGIWIWSPKGEHLGSIVVPQQPANLAWGDDDRKTLYITATTSVYRLRTKAHGFMH